MLLTNAIPDWMARDKNADESKAEGPVPVHGKSDERSLPPAPNLSPLHDGVGMCILPASIGNSYFTTGRFSRLLELLGEASVPALFMSTSDWDGCGPAHHNFAALNVADKSLQASARDMHRRFRQAVDEAPAISGLSSVYWRGAYGVESYLVERRSLETLVTANRDFESEVLAAAKAPLESIVRHRSLPLTEFSDDQMWRATNYLLDELALLLSLPREMTRDVPSLATKELLVLYHRPWPIFERLLEGQFGIRPDERLKFGVLTVD